MNYILKQKMQFDRRIYFIVLLFYSTAGTKVIRMMLTAMTSVARIMKLIHLFQLKSTLHILGTRQFFSMFTTHIEILI